MPLNCNLFKPSRISNLMSFYNYNSDFRSSQSKLFAPFLCIYEKIELLLTNQISECYQDQMAFIPSNKLNKIRIACFRKTQNTPLIGNAILCYETYPIQSKL